MSLAPFFYKAHHKPKASPLKLVSCRFFVIPKEVHNMANRFKIRRAMSKVDWSLMTEDAYVLEDLGKVAYVQPYLPCEYGTPMRQPFILVLQDQWMLEMCEWLSLNNAWAIDSAFKTNQFWLPLYAIGAPNAMGMGIPLWYRICSFDKVSNLLRKSFRSKQNSRNMHWNTNHRNLPRKTR